MVRFGKAQPYSRSTLDDHKKHLVWTSAHDDRHDEESEKPIVNAQEVTREIIEHPLIVPIITTRIDGTEIFGTAWYSHQDRVIFAIAVWHEGKWKEPRDVGGLRAPIVYVSVPRILGEEGVSFLCTDLREHNAVRTGSGQ